MTEKLHLDTIHILKLKVFASLPALTLSFLSQLMTPFQ